MHLTKQQAEHISKIMGFKYSHHDEDRRYEEDTNTMIYFYQGMSPYTFKLDTVTGECSTSFGDSTKLTRKIEMFLKKIHKNKYKVNEMLEDWDEKNKKVAAYLKEQKLITMKSLEVKHLKSYLNTEFKLMQDCSIWHEPKPDRVVILDGIVDVNGKLPEQYDNIPIKYFTIMYRVDENTSGNSNSTEFKPILYPLSDITKKMAKDYGYSVLPKLIKDIERQEVSAIIWNDLLSKHYDVYGLTKKGLAFNMNKLPITETN